MVGELPLHGQQNLLLHTGRIIGQASEPRRVGFVRAGHGEPQPARLRAAEQRLGAQRRAGELRQLLPARQSSGDDGAGQGHARGQHRSRRRRRPAAAQAGPARASRTGPSPTSRSDADGDRGGHRQLRDRLPHAERGARNSPTSAANPSTSASSTASTRRTSTSGSTRRRALRARRLVEAGVRFVEITCPSFDGNNSPWDQHGAAQGEPRKERPHHRPVRRRAHHDLKQRGLLDETHRALGRRDGPHAAHAAGHRDAAATITSTATRSSWPAAASSGGMAYGETDEFGNAVVENPRHDPRHPRHDPAPAGHRPRAAHLPLRRPRPPPDRRSRPRGDANCWTMPILPEGEPIRELP